MSKGIGCAVVVVIVLVILGLALAGTYNRLVGLSQAVDAQWAQVESVYQRRADLIPNLVATVQGAANFEKSTLEAVTQARASVGQAQAGSGSSIPSDPAAFAKFQAAQDALSGALSRLLVVVENYPNLKSDANFQRLMDDLSGTENRIATERMRYNERVQEYNTLRRRFPANMTAKVFGFKEYPYFEAPAAAQQLPKVNFGR